MEDYNHPAKLWLAGKLESLARRLDLVLGLEWEPDTIRREVRCVKKFIVPFTPHLMIDVGGHQGRYAEELLNAFRNIEVHIFEPAQQSINILNARFFSRDNVLVIPVGLSNTTGSLKLFSCDEDSGMSSLVNRRMDHFAYKFNQSEDVRVIKFGDYYREHLAGRIVDLLNRCRGA